jgi:membrane associated rhomboid family serine protease
MTFRKLAAPATLALVIVTVMTYLAQVLLGGDVVERAIGLRADRVTKLAALMNVGEGHLVPAWLTLFTYTFPHGAWWHITMNMAGLWCFGRVAEPIMGRKRFLLVYFISGVVAGLVMAFLCPHWKTPFAGASGAISGILGAFSALQLPRWRVRDHRNLAVLAIESACLISIVAWLIVRTPSPAPDRASALMWHLIPFLAAWAWIRARKLVGPVLEFGGVGEGGHVCVSKMIDAKFADSDQLIRGFGRNHRQLA